MFPSYKVITSKSVLDIPYENDKQFTYECEKLVTEQNKILKANRIDVKETYNLHFFKSRYTSEFVMGIDIDYAIQLLAIKDGVDLVQFEDGNYGFIAYYNGVENGFEILKESEDE